MKKITILAFVLLTAFTSDAYAINAKASEINPHETEMVQPKKDVLVWRFKNINGRLYKRLYNASKKRWESDWIAV